MDRQIAIRATVSDTLNLEKVAAHLRNSGDPFATRSDALRHALSYAAAALSLLDAAAGHKASAA